MELDDLKNAWSAVNTQVEKQDKINLQIFDAMTKKKYHSGMKKMIFAEISGALVCVAAAVFIIFNFSKLNTAFFQGAGIVYLLLLLVLPLISLSILWNFLQLTDVDQPYAVTVKKFALYKIKFLKFQRLSWLLSCLLLVITILLLPKIFMDQNVVLSKYFWILSFPIGYIFLLFFSKWVSRYYRNSLKQAETLLKEL